MGGRHGHGLHGRRRGGRAVIDGRTHRGIGLSSSCGPGWSRTTATPENRLGPCRDLSVGARRDLVMTMLQWSGMVWA